ncbi:DUF2180 family protein [Amycolatopsis sp. NBC_01480]|uniref:DUF2180 family protein n=1 Tax=Amycolatopsis sp. NBC_01480 TaxID=2903562 RepID=UPI002E2B1978|nr:DUF2180 family protein [Amycolatopsis sp. NBC_01480]
MICLDCVQQDEQWSAVGCCVHCGAGTCLAHAAVAEIPPQSPGVLVPSRARRRVECRLCGSSRAGYGAKNGKTLERSRT